MTTSQQIYSLLDDIASVVKPLDNSRFIHLEVKGKAVYVYPEPLKAQKKIKNYVNDNGDIVNLDFSEQLGLYNRIQDKLGIKPRYGDIKENSQAAYSKKAKPYKENVLYPSWIYGGIIAQRLGNEVDVRKALGIRFVDKEVSQPLIQIFIDENGNEISAKQVSRKETIQRQYIVGPSLQTEVPTKLGYFDDFKGVIPIDEELKSKGKCRLWNISFDKSGLSALGLHWYSAVEVLNVALRASLRRYFAGALPIWTDDNPKK